MKRRTAAWYLISWVVLCAWPLALRSEDQPVSEPALKAAFLYNFAKFTEWPATSLSAGTISLCVAGRDPFGGALSSIEGRPVGNASLRVVPGVSDSALKSCQMLFINEPDSRRRLDVLRQVAGMPVLTISDAEGFARNGGMIGLVLADSRLGFEINLKATKGARLRLSSQLLRLAQIVDGE
jgi:hypothetical protein